ncbi:hypothetical protein AXF42_Ash018786 [Apostasia shenzhenica]|uniref:CCHC-type domain-containing protein n=1 Tax=Apostasia shenzhenica TaxID=1088818 RepID=A0A2I0AJZ1_9ASPA|nr:hypothetical protein AXF42_Ash018786 [Apostasia shenzhenica]
MASSLGLPEPNELPAEAEPVKTSACSRSRKTEDFSAAGIAGTEDANCITTTGELGSGFCAEKTAAPSHIAGCTGSSRTEHIAHLTTDINAGITSKNRASGAEIAGNSSANNNDGLNSSLCKEDVGQLLGISPSPQVGALFAATTSSAPATVHAGTPAQNRATGAGLASNSSANAIEGLISCHRKEEDAHMLPSFPSQQTSPLAHNRGMNLFHPAARGVAAHSTACDDVNLVPGEDARGPFGQSGMQVDYAQPVFSFPATSDQSAVANNLHSRTCIPTVRQNAANSILLNAAAPNKPNSPLHAQPNAHQQTFQPLLQKSVASLNQQQGNFLQNTSPKQQLQHPRAASSAWARREYVNFGDIDLSNSAHIQDGVIQLDKASISYMQSKLASTLVGKLFGRKLPFQFLSAELHKRWGHYDGFKVLDASKDSFICQFKNEADRDAVIRSGPWTVAGQILGLDVWSLDFDPSSAGVSTPLWIRLPALPLYCWGKANLARISSEIGAPLWLDPISANMEKIAFARICVRVNLTQPLKPGVWINGPKGKFFQRVEYEGITIACFKCGVVGHRDHNCPLHRPQQKADTSTGSTPLASDDMMDITTNHVAHSENVCKPENVSNQDGKHMHGQTDLSGDAAKESVGPWMLVTNRRRKPHSLTGQLPTLGVNDNLSKPTHSQPLKSARLQQRSSAQQYKAVGAANYQTQSTTKQPSTQHTSAEQC